MTTLTIHPNEVDTESMSALDSDTVEAAFIDPSETGFPLHMHMTSLQNVAEVGAFDEVVINKTFPRPRPSMLVRFKEWVKKIIGWAVDAVTL